MIVLDLLKYKNMRESWLVCFSYILRRSPNASIRCYTTVYTMMIVSGKIGQRSILIHKQKVDKDLFSHGEKLSKKPIVLCKRSIFCPHADLTNDIVHQK